MIINGGIYFSALRDDGGVEDGFYVIHKEMYTKTIEAFRTIMLSTLTYRHLLTFFDLDDVRLMGMPGTVCIRQCGPLLIV